MSRTLETGTRISHYRIISPLAAGGMGEVYMAQDESLDRAVALKVLPAHMVRSEERVRRFVHEAKSASSLNHPHIVTIHEIGQDVPRREGEEGESSAAPLHFIAMEYISGDTLSMKIHKKKTDLKTLLRWLAQAAEGLSKAHGAGIVHRDLKPQNIMVSDDGYAKILDFGLAKLTERVAAEEGVTSAPTQLSGQTKDGVVMGTIGYMSPEQAEGKGTDHRSDIFSFGCILYEAATGRRAFIGDSDVDTLHRIIHENPPPVHEIKPEVPTELRRLIRRCLAKSPERRLQSAKDLAIELSDIVEDFDELSASAASRSTQGSASSASAAYAVAPAKAGLLMKVGIPAVLIIGIAGIAAAVWALRRPAAPEGAAARSFESMKIATLTSSGRVRDAAISPDGNYLAQAVEENGKFALLVKQIATGSDIKIVEGLENPVRGVTFSPDGNYVYYVNQETGGPGYSTLFQAPTLGGTVRKILFDIDAAAAFSPDRSQIAFPRGYPAEGAVAEMLASADGSGERRIATRQSEGAFRLRPVSWSPDGKSVAAIARAGAVGSQVLIVDVASGKAEPLEDQTWSDINAVAWLPDGSSLLLVGKLQAEQRDQIWMLPRSGGKESRITNDLNNYHGLSLTASGDRFITVQSGGFSNLWTMTQGGVAKQITTATRADDSISQVAAGSGGKILIEGPSGGLHHVWSIDADGKNRVSLTPTGRRARDARLSADGKFIAFSLAKEDGIYHVWRMDADGTNAVQLTTGAGERSFGVSPDNRWVLYARLADTQTWRIPAAGGEAKLFSKQGIFGASYSPDGRYVALGGFDHAPKGNLLIRRIFVVPAEGGDAVYRIDWPDGSGLGWMPDSTALVHVLSQGGADNLWTLPLDGGKGKPITEFKSGRIFYWDWAADGKTLLLSRGESTDDAVMITNFR